MAEPEENVDGPPLEKNNRVVVTVEECLPDIIVISYERGGSLYQGVLLDSNKSRTLPFGVSSLHPVYGIRTGTLGEGVGEGGGGGAAGDCGPGEDALYSVSQRFAYTGHAPISENVSSAGQRCVGIRGSYIQPERSKAPRSGVRLRPRQVLCSRCRAICNENSENVQALGRGRGNNGGGGPGGSGGAGGGGSGGTTGTSGGSSGSNENRQRRTTRQHPNNNSNNKNSGGSSGTTAKRLRVSTAVETKWKRFVIAEKDDKTPQRDVKRKFPADGGGVDKKKRYERWEVIMEDQHTDNQRRDFMRLKEKIDSLIGHCKQLMESMIEEQEGIQLCIAEGDDVTLELERPAADREDNHPQKPHHSLHFEVEGMSVSWQRRDLTRLREDMEAFINAGKPPECQNDSSDGGGSSGCEENRCVKSQSSDRESPRRR